MRPVFPTEAAMKRCAPNANPDLVNMRVTYVNAAFVMNEKGRLKERGRLEAGTMEGCLLMHYPRLLPPVPRLLPPVPVFNFMCLFPCICLDYQSPIMGVLQEENE